MEKQHCCNNCKDTFSYSNKDIVFFEDENNQWEELFCPLCQSFTNLGEKNEKELEFFA